MGSIAELVFGCITVVVGFVVSRVVAPAIEQAIAGTSPPFDYALIAEYGGIGFMGIGGLVALHGLISLFLHARKQGDEGQAQPPRDPPQGRQPRGRAPQGQPGRQPPQQPQQPRDQPRRRPRQQEQPQGQPRQRPDDQQAPPGQENQRRQGAPVQDRDADQPAPQRRGEGQGPVRDRQPSRRDAGEDEDDARGFWKDYRKRDQA